VLPDQCCGRCRFWDQYPTAPGFGVCNKWPLKPLPPITDLGNCSAFEAKPTNNPPQPAIWGKARWGEGIWTRKE
jgi:hypothetical protein